MWGQHSVVPAELCLELAVMEAGGEHGPLVKNDKTKSMADEINKNGAKKKSVKSYLDLLMIWVSIGANNKQINCIWIEFQGVLNIMFQWKCLSNDLFCFNSLSLILHKWQKSNEDSFLSWILIVSLLQSLFLNSENPGPGPASQLLCAGALQKGNPN